jgi:hypothetical protein
LRPMPTAAAGGAMVVMVVPRGVGWVEALGVGAGRWWIGFGAGHW